jgi:hypothetical protein
MKPQDAALKAAVDDSIYSLKDREEALEVMENWLKVKGLTASTKDQIEYISCSAKKAEGMPLLVSLTAVLQEMLSDFGFYAAQKKEGK